MRQTRQTRQLTPRQQLFVDQYLITGNASEAYRRAYPRSLAWNPNSLKVQASDALHKPNVAAAVAEKQQQLATKTELSQEWVLRRLKEEASAGDQSEPNPTRVAALNLIGKHFNLFPDRVENKNINLNVDMEMQAELDRTFTVEELRRLLGKMDAKATGSTTGAGHPR